MLVNDFKITKEEVTMSHNYFVVYVKDVDGKQKFRNDIPQSTCTVDRAAEKEQMIKLKTETFIIFCIFITIFIFSLFDFHQLVPTEL